MKSRGKADGVQRPEGSSPAAVTPRVWDTTGVSERGMHVQG